MGRRSLAAKLGVSQPRRRGNDRSEVPTAPVVLPVPGRLVRTLRTRWWPRFCCRVCCSSWSA